MSDILNMLKTDNIKSAIGRRGTVVIASAFRKRYRLEDGAEIIQEATPEGVLIRPAVTVPVRPYSPREAAGFILQNAVDRKDYQAARQRVKAMGLDADDIPHDPIR